MLGRASLNPFRVDRRAVGKSCVRIEVTAEARGVTRERPAITPKGFCLTPTKCWSSETQAQ